MIAFMRSLVSDFFYECYCFLTPKKWNFILPLPPGLLIEDSYFCSLAKWLCYYIRDRKLSYDGFNSTILSVFSF